MIASLSAPSRRIAFAIAVSLLLHGWFMWGPTIRLPAFKSELPPLLAKLQPLPTAPARPKPKIKRPPKPLPAPEPKVQEAAPPIEEIPPVAGTPVDTGMAASEAVASEVTPAETLAESPPAKPVERPLLPHRARLTFAVNKGTGNFQIGEAIHTLEIEDGHYVLQAVTKTVGLAKLFKAYQLTQYSSGSYTPQTGLQPERFFEQRAEKIGTQRHTMEFDHAAQRAHFSHGGESALPPDTLDILSILYQFPPLAEVETVPVSVSNGKKIERYEFEIATNEMIDTALGKLLTVHLRKLHAPSEEGLEIWLALEYRLFPVKMRIIEKNGEVSGEIIITDIRVEDAPEETTKNATD
ncbi:MAG: DUF3108 domain-containing protein [Sideroxyarcus sp.]|nr:DUF3108 domain-containing protein [Sideroxyarcus sp.]